MKERNILFKIQQAWEDEGINPSYHRQQKERLKREWRILYDAIHIGLYKEEEPLKLTKKETYTTPVTEDYPTNKT